MHSVEGCQVHDLEDDFLPPFSVLTNDEDREKKAEYRAPGTYNIIVNPSSFTELEEYRESADEAASVNPVPEGADQQQQSPSSIPCRSSSKIPLDDPDVVILAKFEDDAGRAPVPNLRHAQSITSVTSSPSVSSCTVVTPHAESGGSFEENSSAQNTLKVPPRRSEDQQLIAHFNNFVRPSFAQVHRDALGTAQDTDTLIAQDVLAKQATCFPPVGILFDPCST